MTPVRDQGEHDRGEHDRGESGQAMAEYAIVVAAVMGVMVGVGFTFMPDFINALQRYYDGFYILLNLPIP